MIVIVLLTTFVIHQTTCQYLSSTEKEINPEDFQHYQEEDAKDLFFRRLEAYEDNLERPALNDFADIPQPGGFNNYERTKRNLDDNLKITDEVKAIVEKHLKESSKADENNTKVENITGSESKLNKKFKFESDNEGPIAINDFIRFRRDAEKSEIKDNKKEIVEGQNENPGEFGDLSVYNDNDKTKQQRTGRMLMEDNDVPEGSREPRGAVKEQWVKQPYPVRSVNIDDNYEDNVAAASASTAPRVHFVTQRRLENSPSLSPLHRSYEREGRARDSSREPPKENPRDVFPGNVDRNYYSKRYNPYPVRSYNPYRDDPYYRYEESRYDPRYGPSEYERDRPQFTNRQRRIIYYATLPEVVRTPPNVNLRDRYSYRDRYDDRYITSPSLSVAEGSSYRYRKPYPFTKSRYEHDMERTKAPYPLKVSTDVNVREVKKNPERRIYSETDSRYAYKTPYRSEEEFDRRT